MVWERVARTAGAGSARRGQRRRAFGFETLESRQLLSVFTVSHTDDSGVGSLRQAILDANLNPGADLIRFRIPTTDPSYVDVDAALPGGDAAADVFVIKPLDNLPFLTDILGGTKLDGSTQHSLTGDTNPFGPEIVLDGSLAGAVDGLRMVSHRNYVLGLAIHSFNGNGIVISTGDENVVAGNYIGVDPTGTQAAANAINGVRIFDASRRNRIGTDGNGVTDLLERNVISANLVGGIRMYGVGTNENVIAGNYIGTNAAGTAALGNGSDGIVVLSGSKLHRIGTNGDGVSDGLERNLISGNFGIGIEFQVSRENIVAGNHIGTNAAGSAALPNAQHGILIAGGRLNRIGTNGDALADAQEGNLISGNGIDGLHIEGAHDNVIAGNMIGTNVTGWAGVPNASDGIHIEFASRNNRIGTNGDGISDALERNLISGNAITGVRLDTGSLNVIAGNFIGTDVAGTAPLPNGTHGVRIGDGAQSNRVGTDANGIADVAERNLLSGNGQLGLLLIDVGTRFNVVAGNYIGTDVTGAGRLGNDGDGLIIAEGADFNRVGTNGDATNDSAERNIIAGNGLAGVVLTVNADDNVVAGNYIGVDVSGNVAMGNTQEGLRIEISSRRNRVGTDGNGVGDAAERNIISGNTLAGVKITRASNDNVVAGNYIGTNRTGTQALANAEGGVAIFVAAKRNRIGTNGDALADPAERNLISGNVLHGVVITGLGTDDNVVAGNFIGTTASGLLPLSNSGSGVRIANNALRNRVGTNGDGSGDVAERNVISAHGGDGVAIEAASATIVAGNLIGTDKTGLVPLPNLGHGVFVSAGARNVRIGTNGDGNADATERNLIAANLRRGILIRDADTLYTVVAGNYVGVDANGSAALGNGMEGIWLVGASHTRIGTNGDGLADALEGNVVSDNGMIGIRIEGGEYNVLAGNFVGTNAAGTAALGNGADGIRLNGGTRFNRVGTDANGIGDAEERNLISGNVDHGMRIDDAHNNSVAGNYIGTDVTGTIALGNAQDGIRMVRAGNNAIGGGPALANRIAFNAVAGVSLFGLTTQGNRIRANSIFANGTQGIDFLGNGVITPIDALDADVGPNRLQNCPVLTGLQRGANTRVIGSFHSAANTPFTIDFYATTLADAEGARWLGSAVVTTNASGNALFDVLLVLGTSANETVTATATDPAGNTSEFSAAFAG